MGVASTRSSNTTSRKDALHDLDQASAKKLCTTAPRQCIVSNASVIGSRASSCDAHGERLASLALRARRFIDVHVHPALRADRVRNVIAHPRVSERILDIVERHPPRRVRDEQLGALRRIGKAASIVEQLVEFGQIESRLILLASIGTIEELHEILGIWVI